MPGRRQRKWSGQRRQATGFSVRRGTGALAFAAANKATHVVGMGIVNQHAHGGVRIERVAWLPVLRLSFQPAPGNSSAMLSSSSRRVPAMHTCPLGCRRCRRRWREPLVADPGNRRRRMLAFAARFQPHAFHIAVAGVFQQLLAVRGNR